MVKTSFVTATSVVERAASLNLEHVFEKARPIKGIAQFDFIEQNDAGFNTRRFSTEFVTPMTDDDEEEETGCSRVCASERSCRGCEDHRETSTCCIHLHGTRTLNHTNNMKYI